MPLWRHLLLLAALVVNLWVGGALVEAWAGHAVRALFELALIAGYAVWVLGVRFRARESRDPRDPGER